MLFSITNNFPIKAATTGIFDNRNHYLAFYLFFFIPSFIHRCHLIFRPKLLKFSYETFIIPQ